MDDSLCEENIPALEEGLCNLEKQIENVRIFGVPVVVAVNRFASDTDKEIELVKRKAIEYGAFDCKVSQAWYHGSKGVEELAKSVVKACSAEKKFGFLYPLDVSIKEKIETIASRIYGAKTVEYSDAAESKIKRYTQCGWDNLPVCMAKTQLSLSADANLKGRPRDFVFPISDIHASIGAGFLYPLCGRIQTMPGLPETPSGENIDFDENGNICGMD